MPSWRLLRLSHFGTRNITGLWGEKRDYERRTESNLATMSGALIAATLPVVMRST